MAATQQQIRINELARELEVKAKVILELLPELGVTEKKTHSSSIDLATADRIREHFRRLNEPATAPAPSPQAAAPQTPAPPASAAAAPVQPAAGEGAVGAPAATRPAPVPPQPSAGAVSAPPRPVAVPPRLPRPAVPPAGRSAAAPATPAAASPQAPPASTAVSRPAAPSTPAARPSAPAASRGGPATATPATQRPSAPTMPRPSGPAPGPGMRPAAGAQRPSAPGTRPAAPGARPGTSAAGTARPGARPLRPAAATVPVLPPKPEPGKPIYERKRTVPERLQVERRFEEGERKLHPVRQRAATASRPATVEPAQVVYPPREITITEGTTVRQLAEKLGVKAKELLAALIQRGELVTINSVLDTQMAVDIAAHFNATARVVPFEEHEAAEIAQETVPEKLVPRPPVVTVMGHVDHGKTSLLDAIRKTRVAESEAGGITQHIGASQVWVGDKRIVFIDTPGHEAFTRMRARGAQVTDLVVLVVAADDGVMPQTREAIDHARAAGVPILVAINKIDKPEAQPERVKRQLADLGLVPEEWGGDTVFVEVSARTGQNIQQLLEMIVLLGELRDLKANPDAPARATVLEARLDRGRGPVATVLVQQGTLRVGDTFLCGNVYGKVRALYDDRGQPVKEAGPATPVEVLGLQGVPEAGDQLVVTDEARARQIAEVRQSKQREAARGRAGSRLTLERLQEQLRTGEMKELPVVIKADVQGSVEVLEELLPKLSNEQVSLKILHAGVGAVTENDVQLAAASGGLIVAFNVQPDRKALEVAQQEKVEIRTYSVIYELTEEMRKLLAGMLEPVTREIVLGRAEVRETFRIKGVGTVAGCYVQEGVLRRDADVRVVRDGTVVYTGRIGSLRRFKEDVQEVRAGFECGVGITNFNDVKVGDVLECFTVERVAMQAA